MSIGIKYKMLSYLSLTSFFFLRTPGSLLRQSFPKCQPEVPSKSHHPPGGAAGDFPPPGGRKIHCRGGKRRGGGGALPGNPLASLPPWFFPRSYHKLQLILWKKKKKYLPHRSLSLLKTAGLLYVSGKSKYGFKHEMVGPWQCWWKSSLLKTSKNMLKLPKSSMVL